MFQSKPLASRTTSGILLILAPLIFSFALALDIYVPSIPTIRDYFGVGTGVMQLTVSLFILVTGIGQLILGPISDHIGRRKIVLASILLLLIGSVICAAAWNITALIFGRIVEGIGACGMMVTCLAIVRDLFSENECARIYSFLNSTISLSPLLAPLMGGYIAYFINWRASFLFLALLAAIIFISTKINVNETLNPKNKKYLDKNFLKDYLHVLKKPEFLIYTFCDCAAFAGFLTFFSVSPYIIISLLHVSSEHFGFYFGEIGIVFFLGSLLSGYCSKHLGIYKTVVIGAVLMLSSGVVMAWWYYIFGLSIEAFMVPMALMATGGAFMMGAGAGGAISPFPEMAGTASALFGCLQFVFAFIVCQLVLEFSVNSTLPLAYTLAGFGLLAFITILAGRKRLVKMG
jgi:DHA1 family florfenicol/chloramphenicol resistance protein-like MFS transporter